MRHIPDVSRPQVKKTENETILVPKNDSPTRLVYIAATAALHDLPDTDVGFLYSGQPVKSTSKLPPLPTAFISPCKPHNTDLLLMTATTDMEQQLQQALREANDRDMHRKDTVAGLQSAAVLQGKYCEVVHSQLAGNEEKKQGTRKGKLVGDGLPRVLTDSVFIGRVIEQEENQVREAAEKEARKVTRMTRKAELDAWIIAKGVRTEANLVLVAGWKVEVAGWEQKRAQMKNNGKTRGWGKVPSRPKMVPAVIKPGIRATTENDGDDDSSSTGDENEEE